MCLQSDRQRLGWSRSPKGFLPPMSGAAAGKTHTTAGGASGALWASLILCGLSAWGSRVAALLLEVSRVSVPREASKYAPPFHT